MQPSAHLLGDSVARRTAREVRARERWVPGKRARRRLQHPSAWAGGAPSMTVKDPGAARSLTLPQSQPERPRKIRSQNGLSLP